MKVMFTCQTCGSTVGYELIAVETHELRRYGVHRYECVQPCTTCSDPESAHDRFTFETAAEPRSKSAWELHPTIDLLQEAALASV